MLHPFSNCRICIIFPDQYKQIFELCLPIAFVGILVAIKGAVEDSDAFAPEEVAAKFPSNNDALKLFSFTDYVTALQAKRVCTASSDILPSFVGRRLSDDTANGRALEETSICEENLEGFAACTFGGVCDCAELVERPESTGCGGVFSSSAFGEFSVDELCPVFCGVCSEGETVASPPASSEQSSGTTLCKDNLAESPSCTFAGLCECADLLARPESTGCGGVFASPGGEFPINDLCPLTCGVCSEGEEVALPPEAVGGQVPSEQSDGALLCQDRLGSSLACNFAGICDCADLVEMPESTGCGGKFESPFGDIPIDDECPLYCGVCKEGEPLPERKPTLSISGIVDGGYNWQVPFVKCDSRLCEEEGEDARGFCEYLALGVAPSTADDALGLKQAEAFRDFIYQRYPVLLDSTALPFDFEFVQIFESNAQVEAYVTSKEYGGDIPKLGLAVVFDGKTDPTINYNYAIRHNATGFNSPEDEGRPATLTTPPTDQLFESFARTDDESCPELVGGTPDLGPYGTSCTGRYAYNGFLTIQRLVHDFIIADSGAADAGYVVSEGGVAFVPFPSAAYVINGKQIQNLIDFRLSRFPPNLISSSQPLNVFHANL